jgi:hypothetical protein
MGNRHASNKERGIAYHEAGHAVASLVCGRVGKLRRVTIVPDPDSGNLGHVMHWSTPSFRPDVQRDTRTRLRAEAEIVVLLAGGIAERRATGRAPGCGSDHAKAADIALAVSAGDAEATAFMRWLTRRTENLVEVCWGAIEAVATELQARKTLRGASEVRQIVTRWLTPDTPAIEGRS